MTYKIYGFESKMSEKTFSDMYDIMEYSFPDDERRDRNAQRIIADNPAFETLIAEENDAVIGFMTFWELSDCIYIEHFAVSQKLRGKGLGAEMIKQFCERFDGRRIVLETEPPTLGEIAARRVGFYKRLGFFLNDFPYFQPPYRENANPVKLYIMSLCEPLSEDNFNNVKRQLYSIVYGIHEDI